MPRTLAPGQRARILTLDVDSGEVQVVHESDEVLYEAPNWSLDGTTLYVNGDGHLFRLPLEGDGAPERIDLGDIPELNNDHVLDPDGEHVFVSAQDWHIYRAPLAGGEAVRITNATGGDRMHFLHGVSPDGLTLAYIGITAEENGAWGVGNVFTIPAAGGEDVQITDDEFPDDGSEYSPDGEWIYFNSERARTVPGHAQLFRMRTDGSGAEQLTHDERVNWFPHVSPDGGRIAYVSFPTGTLGHPADRDVILRLCAADGSDVRDLRHLLGGQGTINVPSWSPDGTRIAFVEYPVEARS
ncbi:TolB family protein [Microbacterium tumbae]